MGAVLVLPNTIYDVAESLEPEDFFRESHQLIFQHVLKLHEQQGAIDLILVTDRLRSTGDLEKTGGVDYLTNLAQSVPAAANLLAYCRVVKAKAVLRSIIRAAGHIVDKGYRDEEGFEKLLAETETKLLQLADRKGDRTYVSLQEILPPAVKALEQAYQHQGQVSGVATGFVEFDELTTGFHPSDLVIIAGRPAMGKTAFGLSIVLNVAMRGESVLFFSLEMSREQLATRILCAEARVNSQELRQGRTKPGQWHVIIEAANRLNDVPLYIDDSPFLSPRELRAKARRFTREHPLKLMVIDYLQLMVNPDARENRQVEISAISRGLKLLAKELNIPIVALAQLSRAVENRADKRPILADLRESGAIEQDADTIVFLFRQEYYDRLLSREPAEDVQGVAEIIVGKQRNGPTGNVRLAFLERFARFENLSFRQGDRR